MGSVHCFKLVYDRESGKPKGYGFCEYGDPQTAQSAMRNLNGYELNGRPLRVDCATNERFKDDLKLLQNTTTGPAFETSYGQDIEPDKAPETIAKIITSYPPEQLYDLVRNLKACAMTNKNETRNMLLQNPQLAYAVLQALVAVKCIDIHQASQMLYRQNHPPIMIQPANVGPVPAPTNMGMPPPQQQPPPGHMMMNQGLPPMQAPPPGMMQPQQPPPVHNPWPTPEQQQHLGEPFNRGPMPAPVHSVFDQRHMDPRVRDGTAPVIQQQPLPPANSHDPRIRGQTFDPRIMQQNQPNPMAARGPPVNVPQPVPPPTQAAGPRGPKPPVPAGASPQNAPATPSQEEQDKAKLIMQVLSLTDQQIAMLPPEQRQQILILKEQFSRTNTV